MSDLSGIAIGALLATAFWAVVAVFGTGTTVWTKELAAPAATIFAAIAAGWIAYRLGKNQIIVAQAQTDIAERNWKTSNEKIECGFCWGSCVCVV